MSKMKILLNGIIKENPSFVLVLGACPTLAVTTLAVNGLGMGLATTFVLLGSNVVISLLKNIIPQKVRIPSYIIVIAGFVTMVSMLIKAFSPSLDASLGIFIPLIVVNCIILGRAEMFAGKNSVASSAMDGIGMGIGFTLALLIIGSIREILSAGTLFGMTIIPDMTPIAFFGLPAGGFLTFGIIIAIVNFITKTTAEQRKKKACVSCGLCEAMECSERKEEDKS